ILMESERVAREIGSELPAGVEIHVASPDGNPIADLAAMMSARGFARMIFVATDAIGLEPRTIRTELSALATDPVVAGRTPSGNVYLAGMVETEIDAETTVSRSLFDAMNGSEFSGGLPTRLERLARLSELSHL